MKCRFNPWIHLHYQSVHPKIWCIGSSQTPSNVARRKDVKWLLCSDLKSKGWKDDDSQCLVDSQAAFWRFLKRKLSKFPGLQKSLKLHPKRCDVLLSWSLWTHKKGDLREFSLKWWWLYKHPSQNALNSGGWMMSNQPRNMVLLAISILAQDVLRVERDELAMATTGRMEMHLGWSLLCSQRKEMPTAECPKVNPEIERETSKTTWDLEFDAYPSCKARIPLSEISALYFSSCWFV